MARRQSGRSSDEYSLRSLSPTRVLNGNGHTSGYQPQPGSMDNSVYERYKGFKIDLYSHPCYAAASSGPLPPSFDHGEFPQAYGAHFQGLRESFNWKPAFSGKIFRQLLWITIWLILISHFLVSFLAREGEQSNLRIWLPAALAALMARVTTTVVAAETRRESYLVHSSNLNKTLHRKALRQHRWLVLYILAPLISVPLSTMRYVTTSSSFFFFGASADIYTFSSWKDSIHKFGVNVPTMEIFPYHKRQTPTPFSIRETWRLVENSSDIRSSMRGWHDVPRSIKFDQVEYGVDPTNSLKGWDELITGEAVVMPVFLAPTLGSGTVSATISTPLRLFSPFLQCTLLEQENPWHLNQTVEFVFKNCNATIKIRNETLHPNFYNQLRETLDEAVADVQRVLGENPDEPIVSRLGRHLERLEEEIELLQRGESIQVLQPELTRTGYRVFAGRRPCQRSFFFIGDNRSFRKSNETYIPVGDLSAAFCEAHFLAKHVEGQLWWDQKGFSQFGQSQMSGALKYISKGGLDLKSAPDVSQWGKLLELFTVSQRQYADWYWREIDHESTVTLSRRIASKFPQRLGRSDLWPQSLIRYRLADAITEGRTDVASLVLASKIFSSWTAEQLSETADMVLGERIASSLDRNGYVKGLEKIRVNLQETKLKLGDFSSWWWFRIVTLIIAALCTSSVWSSSEFSNDQPSGLPWSIESIAAKAALLVNSRLRAKFASSNHSPNEIFTVPGLTLGYWRSHGRGMATTWHLDSRCNEITADARPTEDRSQQNATLWQRHSKTSLPAVVNPYVDMTKSIVILIVMIIAIPLARHLEFGKAANSYLPAVLILDEIVEPGWRGTLIFFLLPQFLSFALIAWWDDLDLFYRERRPWASLSAPSPAHLNITLDYLNCRSRIWKALMMRDYPVFLLGVGSMLSFLHPLFSASLFHLEKSIHPIGTTRGEQHYVWDTTDVELVTTSMHHGIPLSAVTALLRPPQTIDGIKQSEAVLPFELYPSVEQSTMTPGSFWQAQTKSLRTELDCRPLSKSRIVWGDLEGGTVKQPQVIDIVLPDGLLFDDESTNFTIKACGGLFDMDEDLIAMNLKQQDFFCSRWIFRSIRASSEPDLHPAWIIPMVLGDLHSRHPQWGPLLLPGCTAMVLLCVPDAYLGSGTVQVAQSVDARHPQGFITQHKYDRAQEEKLPDRISWTFSRMLNNSIHNASTGLSSFAVPGPPIDSMNFVGDLMGYLMYRTLVSHQSSIWELEKPISDIYSTIFAHVVGESDWLRKNVSSIIEVTQAQWREAFRMRLWVLCLMIILLFFFASTAVPLVWIGKKYSFPVAPESIENSLFLLYQSTIVDSLKSIPHPEKLTINAFHRQVEMLGHKYMFGRYRESDKHYEQFGVDRAEEFEIDQIIAEDGNPAREEQGRQAKRYRDDPAESESSSSDESGESDDRTNKRHRNSRRLRDSRHREYHDVDDDDDDDNNSNNNSQENQPDQREDGRKWSDGQAETFRSNYQRPEPATTQGHRSRDQQNSISLGNFPNTKHLPEPQHKKTNSGTRTPPRVYTLADFPDLSGLSKLIKPSIKDNSRLQPQNPTQDSKSNRSHVPSSASGKSTTGVPESPEGDSKRPEHSLASASNGLSTTANTTDKVDNIVRNKSKTSQPPEYDPDAFLITDIDAFIKNLEAEGTIAPANAETGIVGTRLEQKDDHSMSAGSATAFLIDQSEDLAEDRDEGEIKTAREGEHSGELEDDNGDDSKDGRTVQHEHEDEEAGKDEVESANISNSQHSITSPIASAEALDFESHDSSQDENPAEDVYDDGEDQKHDNIHDEDKDIYGNVKSDAHDKDGKSESGDEAEEKLVNPRLVALPASDIEDEDKDKSESAKNDAHNRGGKSEDVDETEEKLDDPRLIALPASDIEDEDLEADTAPLLDLSASIREIFRAESKHKHADKEEESLTGSNGNEKTVEGTRADEVTSESSHEGAFKDSIEDVDE